MLEPGQETCAKQASAGWLIWAFLSWGVGHRNVGKFWFADPSFSMSNSISMLIWLL